ncbi:hypothetical protein L1887_23163 [Cichorium endivia]|nr:hypothetical protein L1887_23163 [Cichorium endivia]
METDRPKSLLAKLKTKVIVTEMAAHAFDAMNCITNQELNSYDGVVAVVLNLFPSEFGLGSSGDAIVICTTGARDPVTSALQIILGERLRLDIAQIVIWKTSRTSIHEPRKVKIYDGWAQDDMIMQEQRSYEAEVAYMKVESEKTDKGAYERRKKAFWVLSKEPEGVVCHAKCDVCNMDQKSEGLQESNLVSVKRAVS